MIEQVTVEHAEKIIELLGYGLVGGLGEPEPGKMCVEAVVCFAMGLPHSDRPTCVSAGLRALQIQINDTHWWSSDIARANGMKRLALIQLGSAGVLDEIKFAKEVANLSKKYADRAARSAAKYAGYAGYAAESAARSAKYAAKYAEYAAEYAEYAEYARSAESAARSAESAARSAESAAEYAEYAKYAEYDSDQVLIDFCEDVVQILIKMEVPGIKWLYLAPLSQ